MSAFSKEYIRARAGACTINNGDRIGAKGKAIESGKREGGVNGGGPVRAQTGSANTERQTGGKARGKNERTARGGMVCTATRRLRTLRGERQRAGERERAECAAANSVFTNDVFADGKNGRRRENECGGERGTEKDGRKEKRAKKGKRVWQENGKRSQTGKSGDRGGGTKRGERDGQCGREREERERGREKTRPKQGESRKKQKNRRKTARIAL